MEENNAMNSEQEQVRTEAEPAEGQSAPEQGATLQDAAQAAEKPKKNWKKEAREWIVSIAAALLVVFFCRNYLFQVIRVDGMSMFDTLLDNERLFVSVLDVRLHGVERDDVVICHYPNRGNTNFVKRAVAIPGDQIYRENGVTHVVYQVEGEDGSVRTEDEMLDPELPLFFGMNPSDDYAPYTLGENEYFVVGDNRNNSHDSRDWNDTDPSNDVGPITGDMLVGRVRKVIWPIGDIRDVD